MSHEKWKNVNEWILNHPDFKGKGGGLLPLEVIQTICEKEIIPTPSKNEFLEQVTVDDDSYQDEIDDRDEGNKETEKPESDNKDDPGFTAEDIVPF